MNHYRHMMEQVALSDRKKEEIMEQLETKATQKRRMPRARTLILAAALAVGALLSIAAGLPAQVYNFATGGQVNVMPGEVSGTFDNVAAPVKAEAGRLWLEADGQRLDITDKVDENTPYIYERTDPVTGEKGLMVVGGTVEDFGWVEFFIVDGMVYAAQGDNYADYPVELPDGSEVDFFSLTDEQKALLGGKDGEDNCISAREVKRPWLQAAVDQLGLELW